MFSFWRETQNPQVSCVNREELLYLKAFKNIENVGDRTIDKIFRKFNSFKSGWNADDDEIKELKIQAKTITSLLRARKTIDISSVEKEIDEILSQGTRIGTKFDGQDYPGQLYELKDPPSLVYIKGTIKEADENALAIVGTRTPSQLGRKVARTAARKIAESGATIISGLARGIDTEAHLGALDGEGRTGAVLGTGFSKDVFYPKENFSLFNRILENGFCISEFPPHAPGLKYKMYLRNRIISILSKGVLIVETSNKTHSGTLTQAYYAKNQGRKVFVMDSIDRVSGDNKGWRLLREEVNPFVVQSHEDLLDELHRPMVGQSNLFRYGITTTE
jgi:DNA processing protein